ncbi:MAG TPA: hypothetical protein VMW42_10835 [Desulfatiglandales bacterium]|nr:hypothetical protein [Desulfatiglandales bacterium]
MKEISLYKFSPLADQVAEDTIIRIDQDLPAFPHHMDSEDTTWFYQNQAEILANALLDVLPQGIIEPLIIEFLKRRISLYRGKMQ